MPNFEDFIDQLTRKEAVSDLSRLGPIRPRRV